MQENNRRRNPFLFAPVLLFPALLLLGIASFVFSEPLARNVGSFAAILIFLFVFGLPTVLFFCLRGGRWLSSCLLPVSGRGFLYSMGAAVLLIMQNIIFHSLTIEKFFDYRIYTVYGLSFEPAMDSFGSALLSFCAFALLPALLEGVLFRGIFMYEYRFGGVLFSVLLSSFLCAMTGMSVQLFPLHFLNGIVLCMTVFVTGNLPCSVFAHLTALTFSLFEEKYFMFLAEEQETRMFMIFILLGVWLPAVVFFSDSAEKILRKRGEREDKKPICVPKGVGATVFFDVVSAPMLWADVLCFSVFSVLHLFL